MIKIVIFEGVKATVQKANFKFLTVAVLAAFTLILTGCPDSPTGLGETPRSDEAAATVNGKTIRFEEVEKAIKLQAKGQESKLSPLELAQARLQVLAQLIQEEVMYQKAESEQTIPSDDEVAAELNKNKTSSGVSKEEFEKRMKEAGETEESLRVTLKRRLAISKLVDKIAGKVEPPNNSEIEAFYNGNKAVFVKKRGVQLAAIVVDARNSGAGDKTVDQTSANLKLQEILKKLNSGVDFATLASSESEDPSRLRKGDLGYISEEQMKQSFSPQIAAGFMNEQFKIGRVTSPIPLNGKVYIFKLQDRKLKEEKLTLESPGVRQQIADTLVKNRKQLLNASYAAIAMNEAKIENYLAKKVVDNPNELSGARPASSNKDAKSDSKSESNSNSDSKSNSDSGEKSDKKADDKKSEDKKSDGKKVEDKSAEKPKSDSKEKADGKKDDKK